MFYSARAYARPTYLSMRLGRMLVEKGQVTVLGIFNMESIEGMELHREPVFTLRSI